MGRQLCLSFGSPRALNSTSLPARVLYHFGNLPARSWERQFLCRVMGSSMWRQQSSQGRLTPELETSHRLGQGGRAWEVLARKPQTHCSDGPGATEGQQDKTDCISTFLVDEVAPWGAWPY